MVEHATKSCLPLWTRSTHIGLVFGVVPKNAKIALLAFDVKTPALNADSTTDFAVALSESAIVIPILSLKVSANNFHLAGSPP